MITTASILSVTAIILCFLLFVLGVTSGAWKTTNNRYQYINKPFQPRLPKPGVDILNVVAVTMYVLTVLGCVAGTVAIVASRFF